MSDEYTVIIQPPEVVETVEIVSVAPVVVVAVEKVGIAGQQGPVGPAGSDASVTEESIEAALGYLPPDPFLMPSWSGGGDSWQSDQSIGSTLSLFAPTLSLNSGGYISFNGMDQLDGEAGPRWNGNPILVVGSNAPVFSFDGSSTWQVNGYDFYATHAGFAGACNLADFSNLAGGLQSSSFKTFTNDDGLKWISDIEIYAPSFRVGQQGIAFADTGAQILWNDNTYSIETSSVFAVASLMLAFDGRVSWPNGSNLYEGNGLGTLLWNEHPVSVQGNNSPVWSLGAMGWETGDASNIVAALAGYAWTSGAADTANYSNYAGKLVSGSVNLSWNPDTTSLDEDAAPFNTYNLSKLINSPSWAFSGVWIPSGAPVYVEYSGQASNYFPGEGIDLALQDRVDWTTYDADLLLKANADLSNVSSSDVKVKTDEIGLGIFEKYVATIPNPNGPVPPTILDVRTRLISPLYLSGGSTDLTTELAAKAPLSHTHTASQISDSTANGRSILMGSALSIDANGLVNLAGPSLTGSQSFSSLNISQVWDVSAAGSPAAVTLDITELQSPNTNSFLLNLRRGGASQFSVRRDGETRATGYMFATGFTNTNSQSGIGWSDVGIVRDASNILAQRNGTNAQTFRLYGTITDSSNYRRLALSSTTAGAFSITPEGLGTGASGNTLTINGSSLTGSDATTAMTVAQTWNTTGVPALLTLSATNTASSNDSTYLKCLIGGSHAFAIERSGAPTEVCHLAGGSRGLTIGNIGGASSGNRFLSMRWQQNLIGLPLNAIFTWGSDVYNINYDLAMLRDAADTLALRRGVNAQAFRVYNTYTDASNYERGIIGWSSNILNIGVDVAGTGSANRGIKIVAGHNGVDFWTGGVQRAVLSSSGLLMLGASINNNGNHMNFMSQTPPAAPSASNARLYVDTSGGKLRLMILFPTGAAQQIAIEP